MASSGTNDDNGFIKSHVVIGGKKCFVRHWQTSSPPKGLVVLFHGFLAHGGYPTVRYAAEFLHQDGYAVVAIDFPGHGQSEGLPGFIPSSGEMISNGMSMVEYATSLYANNKTTKEGSAPCPRLILCGSSMGGAIAMSVAQRLTTATKEGEQKQQQQEPQDPLVVLLAPMLQLGVSSIERTALSCLSFVVPTAQLIPSSATDASKQYRDSTKRKECEDDELTISGGKLRVGSALTCVDLTLHVQSIASKVTCPYLLMIADEDVVVKNEGSEKFWDQSNSVTDKTKKHYPALHGLLCEPSPLFDQIQNDILQWLNERV
eukprot:CAMPEP_0113499524 /NCGR_PEP_ID=MMETSP0014_2-20120614/31797_1 /TAXON_ID=2857 /ORGANISM="Nitzschia sp." /LENGTH=316 /DNA_ID=CAMNT_0000393711 /DNA_START=34 /DNA_END=984 /DNA_ORIENTATION=+ /assembly_acc=CAM_ASM_000159